LIQGLAFARLMDADLNNVPENLQGEVIELQADLVLKSLFNNIALADFYKFYLGEIFIPKHYTINK
jgi:hypothetical protein